METRSIWLRSMNLFGAYAVRFTRTSIPVGGPFGMGFEPLGGVMSPWACYIPSDAVQPAARRKDWRGCLQHNSLRCRVRASISQTRLACETNWSYSIDM